MAASAVCALTNAPGVRERRRGHRSTSLARFGFNRRLDFVVSAAAAAAAAADAPNATSSSSSTLRFRFTAKLSYGETLVVVGSAPSLGSWDASKGARLSWTDGDVWIGEAAIPADTAVEYKLVVASKNKDASDKWEHGANRTVTLAGPPGTCFTVDDHGKPIKSGDGDGNIDIDGGAHTETEPQSVVVKNKTLDLGASSDDDTRRDVAKWRGKSVTFMASNEHNAERTTRQWNVDAVSGTALSLVQGDKAAGSWREKLEMVSAILASPGALSPPSLAACVVYLTWIGTGAVECVENGGASDIIAVVVFACTLRNPHACCAPCTSFFSSRRVSQDIVVPTPRRMPPRLCLSDWSAYKGRCTNTARRRARRNEC